VGAQDYEVAGPDSAAFDEAPDQAARGLIEAGSLMRDWRFEEARQLLEQVLPTLEDDRRFEGYLMFAEIQRELGDVNGAIDSATWIATVHEPSAVDALSIAGASYHDLGDLDEAEAHYHKVLDAGLEEFDRTVTLTRANFALLQRDRGDLPLALKLLSAAYSVHRRTFGAEDLDSVRLAAELGELYRDTGDLAIARRLFSVAHAGARSRLGEDHPFVLAVEQELAAVEPDITATAPEQSLVPAVPPLAAALPVPHQAPPPSYEATGIPVAPRADPGEPTERWWERLPGKVEWAIGAGVVIAGLAAAWIVTGLVHDGNSTGASLAQLNMSLADEGATVVVSWSAQQETLIVGLSHNGGAPVALTYVPPGATGYTVHDLSRTDNYCVVLSPATDDLQLTKANSACTHR
jgi:tetratricopeptide (TPR) repeat protein